MYTIQTIFPKFYREEGDIRWSQLEMASRGARFFTDDASMGNKETPLYGGPAPKTRDDIKRIIADLNYSEGRAAYFSSYGVNYTGRVYSDPRTLVVLDNRAKNKSHSSQESDEYFSLYNSLPNDWWGSCGFVSTGNVDKLGVLLENIPDVVPMAYTEGAKAKLKYLGIDYAEIPTPPSTTDPSYGVILREKANRLDYDLSQK